MDDETVFDKSIFPTYRGPVYFFADTYMRVDEGGAVAAPLTPRALCRAVASRDDRRTESRPSPAENCVSPAQPSGSAQPSGLGWVGY